MGGSIWAEISSEAAAMRLHQAVAMRKMTGINPFCDTLFCRQHPACRFLLPSLFEME